MTEQEWLACTDAMKMRECILHNKKVSERKLRLFALACCCRFLHLLTDERSRHALTVAEEFVEGRITHQERAKVAAAAWEAANDARNNRRTGASIAAAVAAARTVDSDWPLFARRFGSSGELGQQYAWQAVQDSVFFTDANEQCALWRDLLGNLFRPVALPSAIFRWKDGCVVQLAETIYEEQSFDHLPILADALEDAGFTDLEILNHCRGPRRHVRGCWVVDLLLGKK
jgi:hypothetical protein